MAADIRFVSFVLAPTGDRLKGLIGWVCCDVNDFVRLDGIAVRRSQSGRHYLRFPERCDRRGRRHPVVRPLTAAARDALEQRILDAIVPFESARRGPTLEATAP